MLSNVGRRGSSQRETEALDEPKALRHTPQHGRLEGPELNAGYRVRYARPCRKRRTNPRAFSARVCLNGDRAVGLGVQGLELF